jgi:dynein assembly factor 3
MDIIKAMGHYGFWGASSPFDFMNIVNQSSFETDTDPLNILLISPGDIRHILTTLSRRRRQKRMRPVNFYILESNCELLAREILLFEIILDFEIPIRQRANLFLEVFGNIKVQERTARYLEIAGNNLRSLVATGIGSLGVVDISHLRYRDKDRLEDCFKSYSRLVPFDIGNYREHRMRGLYADRYDSRKALFDWDWQYSYHNCSGSIIHIKLYREWRESGIAFEFGDQTYTEANRTMLTYVEGQPKSGKDKGATKEVTTLFIHSYKMKSFSAFIVDKGILGRHCYISTFFIWRRCGS